MMTCVPQDGVKNREMLAEVTREQLERLCLEEPQITAIVTWASREAQVAAQQDGSDGSKWAADPEAPPEKNRKLESGSTRSSNSETDSEFDQVLKLGENGAVVSPDTGTVVDADVTAATGIVYNDNSLDTNVGNNVNNRADDVNPMDSAAADDPTPTAAADTSMFKRIKELVEDLENEPIEVGIAYYLICSKWWRQYEELGEVHPP